MFASVAVDAEHLYAALIDEGTILRVDHDDANTVLELARERGRPLGLRVHAGTLAWLEQPWVVDPTRGFSTPRTIVCAMATPAGPLRELARYEGGAWDLALNSTHAAWVRRVDEITSIACVALAGGPVMTLRDEFPGHDPELGFIHLAGNGDAWVLAIPTRSWLREGVALYRLGRDGSLGPKLAFVAGRFNGLDANDQGVALTVARRDSLFATRWDREGRAHTLELEHRGGPLVAATLADDGLYFALGPRVYRLE